MTNNETWVMVAITSVAGIFLISALYAVAYGLIARFGMGEKLDWLRSYWASLAGLVLALILVALVGAAAYSRGGGPLYAFAAFGGGAMLMTAINVLIVRTKSGATISFIQAFMLQLVPNALLVAYSVATRPPF